MSRTKAAFEAVGGIAIFFGFMLVLGLFGFLFIQGGLWLSAKLYPILVSISGLTLAVVVFVLLPNGIWSSTPKFAGSGMIIASYVFGACAWTWSFLITYTLWGGLGLAIGLFMAGVGIVPLAMLATLLGGYWSTLGELTLLLALTFGLRAWGAYLLSKAERSAAITAGVA
jgi:hypothetical protein